MGSNFFRIFMVAIIFSPTVQPASAISTLTTGWMHSASQESGFCMLMRTTMSTMLGAATTGSMETTTVQMYPHSLRTRHPVPGLLELLMPGRQTLWICTWMNTLLVARNIHMLMFLILNIMTRPSLLLSPDALPGPCMRAPTTMEDACVCTLAVHPPVILDSILQSPAWEQ